MLSMLKPKTSSMNPTEAAVPIFAAHPSNTQFYLGNAY